MFEIVTFVMYLFTWKEFSVKKTNFFGKYSENLEELPKKPVSNDANKTPSLAAVVFTVWNGWLPEKNSVCRIHNL